MTEPIIWDISTPQAKAIVDAELLRWITLDEGVHANYWDEWNEAIARLNGDVVPYGFSDDHSKLLAQVNDQTQQQVRIREFVHLGRERPIHENLMGNFIGQRRRLNITPRSNPHKYNLAKVLKARVQYIEDAEMLPEKVYFPAMDCAWPLGLAFIDIGYNPRADKLRGKFEVTCVDVRDVLIDAESRDAFFEDKRRITRRFQADQYDSLRMFRKFPQYDPARFAPDNRYLDPYTKTDINHAVGDKATYYKFQHRRPVQKYYMGVESSAEIQEIDFDQYNYFLGQPEFASLVFVGEEEFEWFIYWFNYSQGCFGIERAEMGCSMVPLPNIQTKSRLYPIGDMKGFKQLSDLLDVLITVFVDNAKRQNIPLVVGGPEMNEFAEQINHAIEHGGFVPAGTNVYYPPAINQSLAMLIPWALGWLQDSANLHSASMGEVPSKQIAKETVQLLVQKDRQSHGRKDVMLRYCLTHVAKAIVGMIAVMESTPGYFRAIDPRPDDIDMIPINQEWTEQQYMAELSSMYKLPVPQPGQEEQYMQAVQQLRQKFEMENDVQVVQVPGAEVQSPDGAVSVTLEQLRKMITASKMTDEQFGQIYQVMPAQVTLFRINELTQDVDVQVTYGVDDDSENDPQYIANRALMLNARGSMSRLDMLRAIGIQNAEEIVKNADEENQMLQIAKFIASDPQLMQQVQTIMQQAATSPKGSGKAA